MSIARYLLDTNILVYLIDGAWETLRDHVEAHEPGTVVTSTLCVAEALFGMARNEQIASLDKLLVAIEPQPFDLAAARAFPQVPFHRGRIDRLIAAQALAQDWTIVTNNVADFADVPGLKIENWTQ